MTVMEEFEAKEKAEFNSAIHGLNRLNACLAMCDSASMALDMFNWFHGCMAVKRELSVWFSAEQQTHFTEIARAINAMLHHKLRMMRGVKSPVDDQLYWMLDTMETDLRGVMHEHGLDAKIQEDAMNSLR
jgi:hypothetical protein